MPTAPFASSSSAAPEGSSRRVPTSGSSRNSRSGADGVAYERRLEACLSRLEAVAVPTIAQVEGPAVGAGCAIALACDLRVCTPTARFGVPIARTLGNVLSIENCARLVEHVGMARTKDLLITGRLLDAAEAPRRAS